MINSTVTMDAMGRTTDALTLLLNHFKAEGDTTADIICMNSCHP